ncbi:MAG: AMP-binding protein [Cyclobacteriaceae bacterium]|nr:AMP-binding protein [Cyclobacteriaceae bacterium]
MGKNRWQKHYPSGIEFEVDPGRYTSVPELLEQSVKKYGVRTAYVNFGKKISFLELDKLSEDFAAYLQNSGLNPGDRIAIQMPNVLQYPVVLFGALRAGLIVVNTNPLYTSREMEHQFKDAGVKAIVILANFASNLERILSRTNIQHVFITEMGDLVGGFKGDLINFIVRRVKKMVPSYHIPIGFKLKKALRDGRHLKFTPPPIKNSDIAFLQYTGGTTGISMGAVLTHKNIISNMLQIREWMKPGLRELEEVAITALPMYHIFALTVNCLCMLQLGAENILITNPRDLESFIRELKKYPFTFITGVNTLFNALLNHPKFTEINFGHLKVSVGGGMAVQQKVAEKWEKLTKCPLVEGYGLSETSPVLSCNPIDGTHRIGTIGLPLSSTQLTIRDDDGKELPMGKAGEICARGPQVMKGYWNREDDTKNAFFEGNWFRTGDIGLMNEDGFFKIIDRKKDMIIVSGFNVYPNEIEEIVSQLEGVLEVAAIGVPDESTSEKVKLYVVKKDQDLTADMIIKHCKENLTNYKIPKQVEFVTELPKSNVGKIIRRLLREKEPVNRDFS